MRFEGKLFILIGWEVIYNLTLDLWTWGYSISLDFIISAFYNFIYSFANAGVLFISTSGSFIYRFIQIDSSLGSILSSKS